MKAADRYLKIVQWSEEDGCYVGSCPGLVYGGVHGDDETKVYEELCQVVAEAVELYETDGKPLPPATANRSYSGKFMLRVGADLHQALALQALKAGDSLNSYCQRVLKKEVKI